MKFLELNSLIKTNILFSRLQAFNSRRTLEIEAYSCKQTKEQKKYRSIQKPLRFYISALDLAFPDYNFSNETMDSFDSISLDILKSELSFVFFTLYKNNEDVAELIDYLNILLQQCVDIDDSAFYVFNKPLISDSNDIRVFLIHDKKKKRVIILKSININESSE